MTKATGKIKVNFGLKQIRLYSLTLYGSYSPPFYFISLISLFLSVSRLRHGEFQCLILSLFLPQNSWGRNYDKPKPQVEAKMLRDEITLFTV